MAELVRQTLRYAAVGVVNTAVGLGAIWTLVALGLSPLTSNALGYALGLTVSFILNRTWTFQARDGMPVVRFLGAFAVCYSANLATLALGLKIAPQAVYLSQAAAVAVYSVLFFVICRYFVFRVRS